MENKIKIFSNEDFGEVRTLTIDNKPYFVGKDVAEILGYANAPKAIRDHVDDEDKLTERFVRSGQNREVIFINESGLYSLILSSKMPNAKKFKRWVTSEVLPTIRKTGGYVTNDDLFIQTYLPYADESTKSLFRVTLNTINQLNHKIEIDKPKVNLQTVLQIRKILLILVLSLSLLTINIRSLVEINYLCGCVTMVILGITMSHTRDT